MCVDTKTITITMVTTTIIINGLSMSKAFTAEEYFDNKCSYFI